MVLSCVMVKVHAMALFCVMFLAWVMVVVLACILVFLAWVMVMVLACILVLAIYPCYGVSPCYVVSPGYSVIFKHLLW